MYGRALHQTDGTQTFQQYGKNNEAIYSVSRGTLNKELMTLAEKEGVKIHFNQRCTKVDVVNNIIFLEQEDGSIKEIQADLLFGADGAFSALRHSYTFLERVNAAQNYLQHGYKELNIPPSPAHQPMMEQNALHIWPRKNFMLIALPNTDYNFTCTLFLPFEGPLSFAQLKSKQDVKSFFETHFKDAMEMMPTLTDDFFNNPTSSLITTHVEPWHYKNKSALIGDAAHAIVPFYGQGMNAGFEDCTILAGLLEEMGEDWDTILKKFDDLRKPNGDAVAELALLNFIEMRDKVADPIFLERKKIEKELGKLYPTQFNSVYEMVSFSHTPYQTALSCINYQNQLLHKIMDEGDFNENRNKEMFIQKLNGWMNEYEQAIQQLEF
jgi:kynurenine 3-monooxygenase